MSFSRHQTLQASRGFTLVEMLVVIGISMMVAVFAIIYSHVGQNQVALTVEKAKVAELMLQARQLTLTDYGASDVCAYGVHFDYAAGTYSLFAYKPPLDPKTGHCPHVASTTPAGLLASSMAEYAASSWELPLAKGVQLAPLGSLPSQCSGGSSLADILFYPPNPTTLLVAALDNPQHAFMSPAKASIVCLETDDNLHTPGIIRVSPGGQITF